MHLNKSLQSREVLKLLKQQLISKEYVDYQFLQRSKIVTSHFQKALPRLPIPELEKTCERYLAAQKPLLIDDVYKKTEENVKQFLGNNGRQLQKLLLDFDRNNLQTSYISELWYDKYLRTRTSLPLNLNPVLVLVDDEKPSQNDQIVRATNLVVSSLRFYKSLKAEMLRPDIYHLNPKKSDTETLTYFLSILPPKLAYILAYLNKAFPLDMSQYPNLFQSTRIPRTDKDKLIVSPNSKHITVQYKGHFYTLDVLSGDNNDIIAANSILEALKSITQISKEANGYPVGLFTTLERNKWAKIREELIVEGNESQLKLIDSALFNLCLDDLAPGNDPYKVTKQFLHSDGTNRWFDKSFSLIVAKDGVSAVNFEHSWGDGVAVLRYTEEILKDSTKNAQIQRDSFTSTKEQLSTTVKPIDFHLSDHLKQLIIEARNDYKTICDNLDVNYTIFEGIGKTLCKKSQVSPDAIMQLGFQVGYHKAYGKFVSTYESCSTAAFKHGRTEAIRPCTVGTRDVALALNSNTKPSKSILKKMIQECSNVHNRLIKEAATGQGFDRHLFALKSLGEKHGIRSSIFDDPEYARIGLDILSTSTLNSPAIYAGGFGPVSKNGFGLGYVIKDEFVGSLVTNYKDFTNGSEFIDALTDSFKEIFSVLESQN